MNNRKDPQTGLVAIKAIMEIFQNKIKKGDLRKFPVMCLFMIQEGNYILEYKNPDNSTGQVILNAQNIINLKYLHHISRIPMDLKIGKKKVIVSSKATMLLIEIK